MESRTAKPSQSTRNGRIGLDRTRIALWAILAFHAITNAVWLALDQRLVNWDPSRHLRNSLGAWQVLHEPGLDMLSRLSRATDVYEPPLAYIATQPLYALFGLSADVAVLTNVIFLGILIFATYGVGKLLYGRHAGLLAAFLVSFYPLVAGYSRIYYTDLALAAMVAANLYFLLRTDDFLDRRASLLFGLTLAAGLLTKKAFVLFAIGPSLLVAGRAVFQVQRVESGLRLGLRPQMGRRLLNMVMAVALGGVLALPWYLDHLRFILRQADAVEEGAARVSFWWYATWLDDDLFLWGLALFLVGVLLALLRQDRRAVFPLVWFGASFLLHSLVQRGHTRYILPLFAPIALLSAWWIVEIRHVGLRRLLLFMTSVVAFACYVIFTWFDPVPVAAQLGFEPAPPLRRPMERLHNSSLWTIPKAVYHAYPPSPLAWPLDDILDAIWSDHQASQPSPAGRISIFMTGNVSGFNRGMLMYFAMLREVESGGQQAFLVRGGGADNVTVRQILDFHYLLVKSDLLGYGMEFFQSIVNGALRTMSGRYREIARFDLPDGTQATLFRRNKPKLAELAEQGQYEPLLQALELDPKDLELHRLLTRAKKVAGRAEQIPEYLELDSLTEAAESAADLVFVGDLYRQQGQAAEAEAQYLRAIELEPDSPLPRLALGQLYQAEGQLDKAVSVYRDGLVALPSSVELHRGLAGVYLALAEEAGSTGQSWTEQAEAEYQAALDLNPGDMDALSSLGTLYRQQHRWDEALSVYRKALRLAPDKVDLWRDLGNVLFESERYYDAIDAYEKALALAPNRLPLRLRLANTYKAAGQPAKAVAVLEQAVEVTPDDAQAWRFLADMYRSLERTEEAIAAYEQVLAINPDNGTAHKALAEIYQNQGDCARALQHWTAYAELRASPEDYAALGDAFRTCGDLEQAIAAYHQAIALEPNTLAAHFGLGLAYEAEGTTDKAIAEWQTVVELAPNSALAKKARERLSAYGQ